MTSFRKRQLRQATPKWADPVAMFHVYCDAAELRSRGHTVVVDHIYPLAGENVCGLHVANNLQIVAAADNTRKRNTCLDLPAFTCPTVLQLDLF